MTTEEKRPITTGKKKKKRVIKKKTVRPPLKVGRRFSDGGEVELEPPKRLVSLWNENKRKCRKRKKAKDFQPPRFLSWCYATNINKRKFRNEIEYLPENILQLQSSVATRSTCWYIFLSSFQFFFLSALLDSSFRNFYRMCSWLRSTRKDTIKENE